MKAKRCCLADNPYCEHYKKDMCTAGIGSCPGQSITPKRKNPVPPPEVKSCKAESKNNLIEVIYCKNCKYWMDSIQKCDNPNVSLGEVYFTEEDYCSYAELKEK